MSDSISRLNAALEGRYRIERQLGEGGMALVYLPSHLNASPHWLAIPKLVVGRSPGGWCDQLVGSVRKGFLPACHRYDCGGRGQQQNSP